MNGEANGWTRREFVKSSAGFAAAAVASGIAVPLASAKPSRSRMDTLRVGLIGCGGRGTGAAVNSMEGSPDTQIVAMADMFKERVDGSRRELSGMKEYADRFKVTDESCFTGFDAYKRLLDSKNVDLVILATPPGFRPTHFAAAIDAGKHVFFEKPVAVDPTGVRKVMAAAKKAEENKLCVVTGHSDGTRRSISKP
jgi:predicted dehydrogenase